ncbi:RidA family protein [Chitinophaga lutea]|uniref:RidA family protein n=1 Tax=Chitinophaga lutea TaxID=2488634 RepID=A0A3N4PR17_9BACT|nr:RidA family protein [Chitinophaga lutea]RPE09189.1 RidA family protein [Chitinophaga lutea]
MKISAPLLPLVLLIAFSGCTVSRKTYDPTGAAFSQAYGIKNFKRLVFVSGQVPEDEKENVPGDFRSQAELTWKNVEKQLKAAGMGLNDIVKYTIYLSDRKYRRENYEVRYKVLGNHQPAMSIIITGIYDEKWLLEIEAIAAK